MLAQTTTPALQGQLTNNSQGYSAANTNPPKRVFHNPLLSSYDQQPYQPVQSIQPLSPFQPTPLPMFSSQNAVPSIQMPFQNQISNNYAQFVQPEVFNQLQPGLYNQMLPGIINQLQYQQVIDNTP